MRKIGLCLLSNRYEQLYRMAQSLSTFPKEEDVNVYVYSEDINSKAKIEIERVSPFPFYWFDGQRLKNREGAIHYLAGRRALFTLADNDGCRYLIQGDDDFVFKPKSSKYNASSWDRFADSIAYLDANPQCGIVQNLSYLGGSVAKLNVVPVVDGHWSTYLGLVFRAEPDVFDRRMNFRGAQEEAALVASFFLRGYYPARAYNSPTDRGKTKRLGEDAENINYNLPFMREKGWGQCFAQWGGKIEDRRWPAKMRAEHRLAALKRGWKPMA